MEEPLIKAFNCADSLQQGSRFIWNLGERGGKSPTLPNLYLVAQGEETRAASLPLPTTTPAFSQLSRSFLARSWLFKKKNNLKVRQFKSPLINRLGPQMPKASLHLVALNPITPVFSGCPCKLIGPPASGLGGWGGGGLGRSSRGKATRLATFPHFGILMGRGRKHWKKA